MVGYIKGKSAIHVARVYGERKRNFVGQHFWARGGFVSTVGRDEAVIREYIRNQEKEDERMHWIREWQTDFTKDWKEQINPAYTKLREALEKTRRWHWQWIAASWILSFLAGISLTLWLAENRTVSPPEPTRHPAPGAPTTFYRQIASGTSPRTERDEWSREYVVLVGRSPGRKSPSLNVTTKVLRCRPYSVSTFTQISGRMDTGRAE